MKCLLLISIMAMLHSSITQSFQVSPATWMNDLMPLIQSQTLTNLTLLGTHDSFAYNLSTSGSFTDSLSVNFGTSQSLSAYDQAMNGVRYFDLRCGFDPSTNQWRAYHGSYGPTVQSVVEQLKWFMATHSNEVIVIEASHFNFQSATARSAPSVAQIIQLYQLFNSTFGPMLLPRSRGFSDAIDTMIANNHRVLITVEQCGSLIVNLPIWCSGALVNTYANTNQLQTMITYNTQQITAYNTNRAALAANNQLFKLSWTLTPSDTDVTNSLISSTAPKTLQAMATTANNQWPSFVDSVDSALPNLILFDFVSQISLGEFLSAAYASNVTVTGQQLPDQSLSSSSSGVAAGDEAALDVVLSSTAASSSGRGSLFNSASSLSPSLLAAALLVVVSLCLTLLM